MKKKVGILVFNEVEVLDFAGPFEVFSLTEVYQEKKFECFLVSEKDIIITARNGLQIKANYTIYNSPKIDILIIPGGYGAEAIEINNRIILNWIYQQKDQVEIIASVCTGAFLLANSKVINNQKVTTHWMDISKLQSDFPLLEVKSNCKYIDNGQIITSGGISAGIEMSLHIIERELGVNIAVNTAKRMEYTWVNEET